MPLHLLGKKSWNVYNSTNIARVKADEAAAAAREAAEEQRMQETDAARRAAILRGQTPPPLPGEDIQKDERLYGRKEGRERKRRKLAGEDDTDMDIRLATSAATIEGDSDSKMLKLRKPALDAPLTDHAGNINLFPVDHKEATKRHKNEEAEKEKKRKERSFEDQYTMRFSNAAGRGAPENPWYLSGGRNGTGRESTAEDKALEYPGLESKDVWGNEDPRRKEREQARITSSDPFAFMQKAQAQLKQSKEDRKKWNDERERELWELRAAQERGSKRERHGKGRKRAEEVEDGLLLDSRERGKDGSSRHRRRHRSRSQSLERSREHGSSSRHGRKRSRIREPGHDEGRKSDRKSSHRHDRRCHEEAHAKR
ncbi:hypothetical protein K458DRAFT_410578 [Lentithecium fluviatile CBS 122367]|uniref:CBF1-interacting co-repressor CIR N-terminal domain-containing protein n=1 Tax=Lentithecium fluviatile CBS 122367 TaxID=1168545 RepID=A0A6G1IDS9_9PLEO|nr:hypothetical protein K458DRAFT_410578 [Lentithecium fluviatile CBS 122367]